MTIEIADTELDAESLAHAVRMAIAYVFDRLRSGVKQAHPDRLDRSWYVGFMDDVGIAKRLRRLLEALDPTEKKENET